jgi:phosphatidate cytidylyltransferase
MMAPLQIRIMTALVLACGMLAIVLWLPPVMTVIVLTAGVLAGAWEWSAFLRPPGKVSRVVYVAVIAALLVPVWHYTATREGRDVVLAVALAWWIVALGWILFAPRRAASWSAALAGVFALVPAWLALMRLRLDLPNGAEWMLFVLILVWVADIGAYFVGGRYGRLRLAPAVSPGKTWEGALGGMVLATVVAVCGSLWFRIPMSLFVPLCVAGVAFSIVGDLTESLLKRFAGIKDSGSIFPGHGGVMDRIDSVTGAAPVLLFGLTAFGVMP